MRKVAFTICAKNYIGLAKVLGKSISQHNKEIDFFIFVADELDELSDLDKNIISAKNYLDISIELWYEMAFKYDLTEFCTAIKPFCFEALIKKMDVESCIFFDPDILVFSDLSSIYTELVSNSIFITPHITTLESNYTGTLEEKKYLFSGVFNLGFIALKNDSIANDFLKWWCVRLKNQCFKSQHENYFTDQKWIDFLPSLIPKGLYVSFDLGNNVAPWNFYERIIYFDEGKYSVSNRITNDNTKYELNFVHFSGFKYGQLIAGEISQGNISDFDTPVDLLPVFKEYEHCLLESDFLTFTHFKYRYNYFTNGVLIDDSHRRMYRRLIEDGTVLDNPFETSSLYYLKLAKAKLLNIKIQKPLNSATELNNNLSKLKYLNRFFKLVSRILGTDKYFNVLKLLRRYSILENQVFLFDKGYADKLTLRR